MKHAARLVALVAVLLASGCLTPSLGAGAPPVDDPPVPRWQAKAIALIEVAQPALDYLAATDEDGSDAEDIARARVALAGLKAIGTAGASLTTLEGLVPMYRDMLLARGKDAGEIEERVFFARALISAVRVALA